MMQNVVSAYTLAFVILSAFTLMAFLLYLFRKKQLLTILPVVATLVTVFLLYRFIGNAAAPYYFDMMALDLCIALVSTILAIFYISKPYIFVGLIILLIAGFMIYLVNYSNQAIGTSTTFAAVFAIGTIYGLLYREFMLGPRRSEKAKKTKKVEINRDIVQIILGIVLIGIILFFSSDYITVAGVIFAFIMLCYTFNNLLANRNLSLLYKRAMDLERKDATYGQGATYLAASTALIVGFNHNVHVLLFGIAVLFFADSMATIVGVSMRRAAQLPYNRNKTIAGSVAFFIIAAIAGFVLIGSFLGPVFALVLAFVESLGTSIDDNIRSGVIVVVLSLLAGL